MRARPGTTAAFDTGPIIGSTGAASGGVAAAAGEVRCGSLVSRRAPGRERGFTLLEVITYLSIAGTVLFAGYSLYGAQRLAHGRQAEMFADAKAVTGTLDDLVADLRGATRAVPRESGPGVVLLRPDGSAAVWFDREGRPDEIWRKVVRGDGTADAPRVHRGVGALTVTTDGALFTATVRAGREERSITIRRRLP